MSSGYNKDFFYKNNEICTEYHLKKKDTSCAINQNVAIKMNKAKDIQQAAEQRYIDTNVYVNREIQFSVNLIAGLGLLLYYVVNNDFATINISPKSI